MAQNEQPGGRRHAAVLEHAPVERVALARSRSARAASDAFISVGEQGVTGRPQRRGVDRERAVARDRYRAASVLQYEPEIDDIQHMFLRAEFRVDQLTLAARRNHAAIDAFRRDADTEHAPPRYLGRIAGRGGT